MALIDERLHLGDDTDGVRSPTAFRPASRRRNRILLGVALLAVAIGGNVLIYTELGRRSPMLQVVRDVPAGSVLVPDDLRPVDVALDPTVRAVEADRMSAVVGRYAKVRLVAGSLVVDDALQDGPLVAAGSAVVAVQVPEGALPVGLRERSQVRLVVPPSRPDADAAVQVVTGRVVGLPTSPASVTGRMSVSVEVDAVDAPLVAASDDVRVVLIEPGVDTAAEPGP